MKQKKFIVSAACVALLLIIGAIVSQPLLLKAVLAKYKSTDHFVILAADARIRYEEPAKESALVLKGVVDASRTQVERALKAQFKKPIAIYVCASQDSFNDYVFLSKNVKGAVYWGKLFLSPAAFFHDEKYLAEITTHELTHYLFYTHVGEKAHLERIPLWFREAIAVFVANGGAVYTNNQGVSDLITSEEKEAYLSGKVNVWFASTDPRDAVTKSGIANWLLCRVGALFVHYMHDSQPENFDKLIQSLLAGAELNVAVERSYGKNVALLREGFAQYLVEKT